MNDYMELFSVFCTVVVLFAAARFGWIAGLYIYRAIISFINFITKSLANYIKKG